MKITYKYVGLTNKWMFMAYNIAKELYQYKKWNLKTTPVAIIVKNNKFISKGISANGKHALLGVCNRLGKPNEPYNKCKYCMPNQHAEVLAIQNAGNINLKGADIYLYGHYKICDNCAKKLQEKGIYNYYLLKNSQILFDRHNINTVLGTDKQFIK